MGKLDLLIKDFNKQYKEDIATRGIAMIQLERIPFSSPRANYMLYGGIPRGRLVEFAGEEGSGKTTTALDIVANAQRLFIAEYINELNELQEKEKKSKTDDIRYNYLLTRKAKQVVYVDCENTLDEEWARKLKVDVDSMVVLKPQSQTAEQIFEMILSLIETDEVGLVVLDSLGVMLSAAAYEKTMEEKTYGGIAAALTLFSKKCELLCVKYNTTFIGINQMREDMNSSYGGQITTGGKGWKHNCSVRLLFRKGNFIDEKNNELKRSSESPSGNLVEISIAKTKICKPDRRTGCYTLKYENGIDVIADTIDLSIKYNIIIQGGSWFTINNVDTAEVLTDAEGNELTFQGKAKLYDFMVSNDDIYNYVSMELSKQLKK